MLHRNNVGDGRLGLRRRGAHRRDAKRKSFAARDAGLLHARLTADERGDELGGGFTGPGLGHGAGLDVSLHEADDRLTTPLHVGVAGLGERRGLGAVLGGPNRRGRLRIGRRCGGLRISRGLSRGRRRRGRGGLRDGTAADAKQKDRADNELDLVHGSEYPVLSLFAPRV